MISLESKVVVITGAKGGVGTYVTQAFLDAKARVVGVSRSIQDSDFRHSGFTAMPAELSDSNAADKLVGDVVQRFGCLDGIIHLVGGFAGGQSVADTDDATVDKMLNLNFLSAFYIMRAGVRRMGRNNSRGRLIAIGSRAITEPPANGAAYTASKAALVALMRSMAVENRDSGVTANVILPSTIDTPANRTADPNADFARWTDPRQIANLAVWLASDEAAQVTGAVIPVFGRGI
jgi:NAD(P)-dependent dehydrogenase (short-subunit alcohol dehydrogenase family)